MKGAILVKEIQIQNLRSLKNTQLQKLSPITLLVGENSSGKSSFLRTFPLLKQSIKKRTSGPILWSGDVDDYVDFGSFEESVTNDNSDQIKFRFKFSIDRLQRFFRYQTRPNSKKQSYDVDFEISVVSKKSKEYVSIFKLTINSFTVIFDLENETITFKNGYVYNSPKEINNINSFDEKSVSFHPRFSEKCTSFNFILPNIYPLIEELYKDIVEKHEDVEFYIIEKAIESIGNDLLLNNKINYIDENNIEDVSSQAYTLLYNSLIKKLKNNKQYENYIKLGFVYMSFDIIDHYIMEYFRNVHYIAPLRATAERYYRLRNLAVDEVDYQGKNLAIFINSLSTKQTKEFNSWTNDNFGFSIGIDKSRGHLSLLIKLKNSNKSINLSDTGFGYSQVLPIITQLWELSTRSHEKTSYGYYRFNDDLLPLVIAIEQPELHLHPAIQAKLTYAFIACIELARKNGRQLQLLLETHSETIVNCLGRAIARGKLNSNDVSIILFEKNDNSPATKVINSSYDQDGFLKDWPYGFFSAED